MEQGYVTLGLEPKNVFRIFEDISRIARPTGNPKNQEGIISWIAKTLDAAGINTLKDYAGNLYAYKKASVGCENVEGILLQAHVDMVCAPNEDIFPLKLMVDGDYLRAKGSSCGLDNGMGIALAMALLMDGKYSHGPLEAAFTLNEDTDCFGAINMEEGYVRSKYMISLDDESWGKICIGSAGAEAYTHSLTFMPVPIKSSVFYELKVSGLTGGHSGYSIEKGQANAIKLCAEVLKGISEVCLPLQIINFEAGVADNAIPYECVVSFILDNTKIGEKDVKDIVEALASDIKKRFADTDPAMKIVIGTDNSKVETMLAESKAMNAMSVETSDSLIKCILACPNGPLAYHFTEDGKKIIQTSSNLAIIKTEGGKVSLRTLSRSSVKSELENTVEDIKKTFKRFCGEYQFTNHSSALCWEPDWNSDFLKIAKEVFRKQEGYNPEVYAPHCYMEGAYFVKIHKVLPIAIGPQIDGAHTVGEKVLIPTVNKCYNIVKSIISSLTVR